VITKSREQEKMMFIQPKAFLTPAEYLAAERKAEYKSGYIAGEVGLYREQVVFII
jgi:hypothetical protein